MHKHFFYCSLLLVSFAFVVTFLCMCTSYGSSHVADRRQWMEANQKLKVLSTTSMIHDLVKNIGGEHVDSYALIKEGLDPHSHQLVKGDDETLAFADIVFYNGLGLEHGPSLQNFLYNSNKAIGLGDKIREKHPELILEQKGQLDPHIWMDVSLWSKTIPFITEALVLKDPRHAEDYRTNAKTLIQELSDTHTAIYKELQGIPKNQRYLVTSHDAFNYFARSYLAEEDELPEAKWKVRVAAPEGLAPESQISVSDIQYIVSHLVQYQIHVLFPESSVSKDSIRKILQAVEENGMQLQIACTYLYSDSMGEPGSDGDTYIKMIRHNAATIALYLKQNVPQQGCR